MNDDNRLEFTLDATCAETSARAATFRTVHGKVRTPVFMPVGTQATVRTQSFDELAAAGSQVLLANTFHLLQRPGPEVFERFGGIHRFMGWNGSVLTDSGGYQIFSLPGRREISEDGALFTAPDGRRVPLTPESSVATQAAIQSDIMMVLDQCIASTAAREEARAAMELTHRWAERSLRTRAPGSRQAMFGIVQGACFEDLRRESARAIAAMPFDGFAIGGLAVGETREQRQDFTALTAELLPADRPRYLMGVGTPIDLLEAVRRGVDMFDCILPTSYAQQGVAWTSRGRVELRRGAYRLSEEALDPECSCAACSRHSRGYLHHLFKAAEPYGWRLIAGHNIAFYHRLTACMRAAILDGRFAGFYAAQKPVLEADDENQPKTPPRRKRRPARPPSELGDYELRESPEGFTTLRQKSSGETMHPVGDPRDEARTLYVEQSCLASRLLGPGPELVVWDVGLGAATNAMAAVACRESLPESARRLRIVSFENDLDPLKLAVAHPVRFEHIRHAAPRAILDSGRWEKPGLKWELLSGDFLETMQTAPGPDLIFFDPFSSETNPRLWSVECFARMLARAREGVELYTYTASTIVRARMLAAGFAVARGRATGTKAETTVALAPGASHAELLGTEWLSRWERSGARDPELDRAVRGHAQFVP